VDYVEKILGTYYLEETDENSPFANSFTLKLYVKENQIKFDFIMVTSGKFGKVGKDWYGKGIFRNDHLALIIEKEKDWTYTVEDDETAEYLREKYETLPIEIFTEEQKVIVYHKDMDKYLTLYKN
jgi:hypothetical protein